MQDITTNGNGQRLDVARGMAMMGSEGSLRKILSTVLASLRADLLPAYQQLAPELHGLLTEIQDFLK